MDELLATARQKPAAHEPHEEEAVYAEPPELKVPTGQGEGGDAEANALVAAGQK